MVGSGANGPENEDQGFDDDFFLEEKDINWEDAENLQGMAPSSGAPARAKTRTVKFVSNCCHCLAFSEDENSDPISSARQRENTSRKRRKGDQNQTSDNKSNSKEEADLGLLLLDDRAIHQAAKGLRLDPASNVSVD